MNNLIQEKIKDSHFTFYKKMNFKHRPDCICKQWQSPLSSEIIAEVKKPDTLETIEQKSFEKEEFKEEELGF